MPANRHPDLASVVVHRSPLVTPGSFTRRAGIPVTKPALTLLQLGAVAPELVAGATEDALFSRLVTVAGLWRAVELFADSGRNGAGVLRRLLLARDPSLAPTESTLEDEIVAAIGRQRAAPPVRQHKVAWSGHRSIRLDIAYPPALLDVEGDGMRWHTSIADVRRDRERANFLVASGWAILRYTQAEVRSDAAGVVREIMSVRGTRLRSLAS